METIRTPSRLHLSLIDMNGGLGRVDGGIGIALEEPGFEMSFEKSGSVSGVEGEAKEIAEKVCRKIGIPGGRIEIKKSVPEHVGFGSKTQLSLGIAAGICKAHNVQMPVKELARIVGRGGTSGIGVAAFEYGGFILDGGHPAKKGFVPSRFSNEGPAPLLARYDFPWWLVCAWPEGKGAHGEPEKNVFSKHCPMPAGEAEKTSRIILMKLLPSLIERDLGNFGEGVNMLQKAGFKKIEVGLQKPVVRRLLASIQKSTAGGGMSSFGPVCFGLCGTESEARSVEKKVKSEFEVNTIITKANNEGVRWL